MSRSRSIQVDDSRWPLVVVVYHGTVADADFDEYLKDLERNLTRCEQARKHCAIMFDTTNGGMSNASQRKKQSEWIQKHRMRCATWCVGYAFAIPSVVVRGMLQAILWLSPMPSEHRVLSTVMEAEAWLYERLRAVSATFTSSGEGAQRSQS